MGETLALSVIVLALAFGAGLGAYRAFQSPVFYAAIIDLLWDKLKPSLLGMIAKDFSPEHVAKVSEAARRAEELPTKFNPHPGDR